MPPKAIADGEHRQTIIALCNMMLSCQELKLDNHLLAPILGVSHAKNVPRKINTLVGPYGFEYASNKLISKDGATAPATPVKAASDSTTTPTAISKTPAKSTAKAAAKTPTKSPASRKRSAPTQSDSAAAKPKATKKRKLDKNADKDNNAADDTEEGKQDDETDDMKPKDKARKPKSDDVTDVIQPEDHPMFHVADDFEKDIGSGEEDAAETTPTKAEVEVEVEED